MRSSARVAMPLRKILLATVGAGALAMAGTLTPAAAISLDPAAMRPAIDAVNPVDKTACWRWGWHGWGFYPCGYYYYGGPYWGHPYWHRHWHRHWRHW